MPKLKRNPFRYGNPVPPEYFIGREEAIRTIFSRIHNCESTAVVGEPHIGKSSILRYIANQRVRSEWLAEVARSCAFIEIDCYLLPENYQPANFWKDVMSRIEQVFPEEMILVQLDVVRRSAFGSFTLKSLFDLLAEKGWRITLLIDEFDALLHHPNFNTAEFFGALRSLSAVTDGLILVPASRLSVTEMNRRSQAINPYGSPFFNTFTEIRLLPLSPSEVDLLLDQALAGIDITLSQDDRAYIRRMSGRHPYLVQMAAAALFETAAQGSTGLAKYEKSSAMLRVWADAHFNDQWHCLNERARGALILLALAEVRGRRGRTSPNTSHLGTLEQYDLELHQLSDGELIEPAGENARIATRRDNRWRISAESFARWIVDTRKWEQLAGSAGTPQLDSRRRAEEIAALREQRNAHQQRLRVLQLQEAKKGSGADPAITTEIKEIEEKVAEIERQIQVLQK